MFSVRASIVLFVFVVVAMVLVLCPFASQDSRLFTLGRVSRKGAAAGNNNWVDERMTDWREESKTKKESAGTLTYPPTHTETPAGTRRPGRGN